MSLEVEVVNASNLPNVETVGKIDPYVKITIQGITKKTAVVKGELNPNWNEKLVFDLKGQQIREQDELVILINDWERLGRNRLVGRTSLVMRDVLKGGFGQQRLSLSLFDANQRPLGAVLNISILYNPPPGSEINVQPVGREIGGNQGAGEGDAGADLVDAGDAGTDQLDAIGGTGGGQKKAVRRTKVGPSAREPLSTKPQDFQLRVKIIEARQLPGANISPVCRIICHTQTKQTTIQKSTNAPCWNEIFFFNFVISPAELFEKPIIFGIFNSRQLRSDAFIGSFKFDVGLIYDEPRHSFINKWLLLCDPEDTMAGHKGYLKICATLLGPGDDAPTFIPMKMSEAEDDVESNLLRPSGVILRPATLRLKLYHAEDIPRMDSDFIQGVKRVFGSDDRKELVDPYFVFSFAGREIKSKIIYNCEHPEWNQELRLAIRFPSMCERIKFQIFDWDRLTQHDCVGTEFLNMAKISRVGGDTNDGDGFLPTFGPCFVNFYGSPREYSELATGYEELNLGKGDGVAYRGRVLVELQTIVGEVPLTPVEDILIDDILRVQKFMRRRRYKLHTAFMGASMISKVDSAVEFEVSIGNYGNKLDESLPPSACTTQPTNAVFDGSYYYFLPWAERKPCVVIDSHWEDISFRLEALNLLIGITDRLEANISNVRLAQKGNMPLPDLAQCLISLLDNLIIDCRKPLPDILEDFHMQNELDLQLRQFRSTELQYIVGEATKLRETATDINEALAEVENYLASLKNLTVEPQNSIPDIVIWMIADDKRVAYYRVPAHLLLWSNNPDYRGKYCGKRDTILLKYPGSKAERENRWEIPALLRLKIWFGLAKDEHEWHRMQTEGELAVFAETYENQASILGKWKSPPSRPDWSDSTGKVALKKEDFKPPSGWKWVGEWEVSPELSMVYEKDTGHSRFMEDVYECQSRLPGTNWNASSIPWTDVKGDATTARKEIELPEGWKWEDADWQVDLNRAVDEYGWEYTVESTLGGYGPVERNYHMCRRRRWVRTRQLLTSVKTQTDLARRDILTTEGWEYAPLFTMKFHKRERKMDLVRRRRWHRKMVPEEEKKKEAAAQSCFFSFAAKLEESTKEKKEDEDLMKAVMAAPRLFLVCKKPNQYQMRAYVFQGRDLLAGDSSGLSDPFARVVFMNQSQATEKVEKTLCPTWDQTLIFESVDIYSDPRVLADNPPEIVIEVFDHDAFGAAEFLGRARVRPLVTLDPSAPKQPMLQWHEVKKGKQSGGELLMAFELFLIGDGYLQLQSALEMIADGKELPFQPPRNPRNNKIFMVPNGIRPQMTRTAIEVMCWGVRNMKRFQLANVTSPSVEFEVGGQILQSKVIRNTSRNPNFDEPVLFFDVLMPKEELYAPPLNIKVRDNRQFGRKPLVGVFVVKSLESFRCSPLPMDADEDEITSIPNASSLRASRGGDHIVDIRSDEKSPVQKKTSYLLSSKPKMTSKSPIDLWEEDIDWWSKFYASVGELDKCKQYLELGYDKIQVYDSELEKVPEFNEFSDFCHTFSLVRGKNIEDEESSQIGEFKGTFRVYQLPGDPSAPLPPRILKNLPPSGPIECVVRVYIIRAIELQPKDPSGLADPYILIKAGKSKIHNRNEYIPNSLNPVFGRMFEVKVSLPIEKDLIIRVKDYDVVGSDDTVGETIIDLENRYLTKYRATVGLPQSYCESGLCLWRDSQKPTDILKSFCESHLRCSPVVVDDNNVRINGRTYTLSEYETKKPVHTNLGPAKERLALHVLNNMPATMGMPLVPEHVETRKLYNPLQPGIEQGRLQMWIDIFPTTTGPPGPPVDIKSRKPKKFELRVIIWNTKDVILDETSITGERMSDIYVKGWIRGVDEKQETDVHYRSLDGEGNFNWRFVFPMDYVLAEQCLMIKKKEHFWSLDETEKKIPPVVIFQIWDNDKFNPDDFLGALEMNLESMPQPVRMSEKCSLDQLPNIQLSGGSDVKLVSLFEQKRLKGFWPVYNDAGGVRQLTGKVEMELELVTEGEAAEKPVGRARDSPNQHPKLDPPQRPDTSFLWFTSPWKTCKFIVWRRFRWYFIGAIILIFIILFIILFFYAIPGTAVKKMFGVQ